MNWLHSQSYNEMVEAQLYLHNLTAIENKRFITKIVDTDVRSNAKLHTGLYSAIARQRCDYLLSAPAILPDGISQHELRLLALDYICTGTAVLGLVADGDGLRRLPPESVSAFDDTWQGYSAIAPRLRHDNSVDYDTIPAPQWFTVVRSGMPSLYQSIRDYVDGYELLLSRKHDVLADMPASPLLVKGYLDDPDSLVNRVREDGVVMLASDGSIEMLPTNVDFTATDEHLAALRAAAYRAGDAVDISSAIEKNHSSVALRLLYVNIDARANELEEALSELLRRASEDGALPFASSEGAPIFRRTTIVNENDAILNCVASMPILSREEILAHHPWINASSSGIADELAREPANSAAQKANEAAGTSSANTMARNNTSNKRKSVSDSER